MPKMPSEIIAEFLAKGSGLPDEVMDLLRALRVSLLALESRLTQAPPSPQEPAVPIAASVRPGMIACLECGKNFRALRFHLRMHGLSPVAYRAKWGLPIDYPITAPNLAERRSALALAREFGRVRKGRRKSDRPTH